MQEKKFNPTVAPLNTRPGQSLEHVGTRNVQTLLPDIFQTTVNKQFLDSTLEQLMSSGSLETINNFYGSLQNKKSTDNYKDSDRTQFVPGFVNKDDQGNITQSLAYDDLLNTLKFNEADLTQHSIQFDEEGYTLDLPINYDMFINYHKYQWLVDVIPPASLKAHSTGPIEIDDIIGKIYYTTPTLATAAPSDQLTFENGMRIRFMPTRVERIIQSTPGNTVFNGVATQGLVVKVYKNNILQTLTTDYVYTANTGDVTFVTAPAVNDEIEIHTFYSMSTSGNYAVGDIYIVDGVGEPSGIKLIKQFTSGQVEGTYSKREWLNHTVYSAQEATGFDENTSSWDFRPFDLREFRMVDRDYVVEQRYAEDQSAWARSNLWIHEDAARVTLAFQDLDESDYIVDKFRAVRPIIEFRNGIEKYSFGKRHIQNVDHYISNGTLNPATDIVGQTSWNHLHGNVTTQWQASNNGYLKGQQVKYIQAGQTTFWECIADHAYTIDPTLIENRNYWAQLSTNNLENGDTILFNNVATLGNVYKNNIYTVGGVGTSITLTQKFGPSSTPINTDDKVLIIYGPDTGDEPKSGSELYWNGSSWFYGQQKTNRSYGCKFQLYDRFFQRLQIYNQSSFKGNCIFNYKHDTSSANDEALGFGLSYADYGNSPGINFDIDLTSAQYTYQNISTDNTLNKTLDILGYYFYKDLNNNSFHNGWKHLRRGQPVKRMIQKTVEDASVPVAFELGTTDLYEDTKFLMTLRNGDIDVAGQNTKLRPYSGKYPTLFVHQNTNYDIETLFPQADVEFVTIEGTALSGITRTVGAFNTFQLQIGAPTFTAFKYRLTATPNEFGVIYIDTNSTQDNITVKKNNKDFTDYTLSGSKVTISTTYLAKDDMFELVYYSDSKLNTNAEGDFLPAESHTHNTQNQAVHTVTFGDLIAHLRDQMENIPGFTGDYFGINNYRKIPHVHEYGGTIRQQGFSTEIFGQLSIDSDSDLFSSIKYSAQQYANFKKQFVQKVKQLHKTQDMSVSVYSIVDQALNSINIGKNKNSVFANSNMAMYKDYEFAEYTVTATDVTFGLPNAVNTYHDAKNHIQLWIKDYTTNTSGVWKPLIKNKNYSITQDTFTLLNGYTLDSSGGTTVHVRWYPQDSVSFIPSSSSKLGLVKPIEPQLNTNYNLTSTGTFGTSILIGHDGSITQRLGTELFDREAPGFSIEDSALWDLELRIYNNLKEPYGINIQDYKCILPRANSTTAYSWSDLTTALLPEFNRWKTRNNKTELASDTYYNGSDEFTFNFSDVGPGIGGYRGLYNYYFNTDEPNRYPFKIFGYNHRPTWWDANYSWTDPTKRAALITAIQLGHYNDPAETPKYDPKYAIPNSVYNWSANTLVTLAGALNGPVTAGVVTTPTDPARAFEFGDWGPVEAEWRRSSDYLISQFVALARIRPLWITNTFFNSGNRSRQQNENINTPQWLNTDTYRRHSLNDPELSDDIYPGSIIERVRVVDPGSGYTSIPTITVFDNFGQDATLLATVRRNLIRTVAVTNPGKFYYSKPTLSPSSGSAVLEAVLKKDAKRYHIGLNSAVVEFAKFNDTSVQELKERFKFLNLQPIIKAGGFINPNNQMFVLESSQNKGKSKIPEENSTSILYLSKPTTEFFYSGIKVDKVDNGYRINGYDNSNLYFSYNEPLKSSRRILVTQDGAEVFRYSKYQSAVSKLNYNSTLATIQDVYDFILGYEQYLIKQGWKASWKGIANNFITWATGTSTDTLFMIPNNQVIQIDEGDRGYFDNINNKYDGVFNLIDKDGKQLLPSSTVFERTLTDSDEPVTTIRAKEKTVQIYGVRLYKVELEHAIIFDNTTNFDDVLYESVIGQRHPRIIWKGSKTQNWIGKLSAPGYLVSGGTIIQNFDSVAREIDQTYTSGAQLTNQQLSDVARFNSGYNKPDWAKDLTLDDNTVYEFVKGTSKYRGTKFALDAFMKNKSLFNSDATADLYEEWAIRTADYGDHKSRRPIEFELTKDMYVANPMPVRFNSSTKYDVLSDTILDLHDESPYLVSGKSGNNLQTRFPYPYFEKFITDSEIWKDDLINAGTPISGETDYRILNKEDFEQFPTETRPAYKFEGDWREIYQWDNKTSYKFNDKVIYNGKTWAMLDPDGSSGLFKPNDPIEVLGTITLPIVSAQGGTLLLDGTTVNISNSVTTTNLDVINLVGNQDISTSNVVTHGSTLVLGENSSVAQTITFLNSVNTTIHNDITKTGTVTNPSFIGSNSKTLIIDGQTVTFNDTVSTTTNITALVALENAFNANSYTGATALATNRINALEALRTAYISATSQAAYDTFIADYFSDPAGIDLALLLTEHGTTPSYTSQLESLISSDVDLINQATGQSYVASAVIAGSTVIPNADILTTRDQIDDGAYIVGFANFVTSNTSTVLATTTVVTTQSGTTFKNYTLSDIVQEINDAGIPNLSASSVGSQLRLTKTTSNNLLPFSLTISVGTANSDVGFSTATETLNSTTTTTTSTPNLTQQQVVDQINNASITGVTAQINSANTNLLQINCNLATLFVGSGTANSLVGITSGVIPAGTSQSSQAIVSNITNIVGAINNAGISGVSASNNNNRLKITSTNATLIVGSGTANGDVGITAQTYSAVQSTVSNLFNAIVGSDGNQVFREMANDPNIFSIHVADDSDFGNFSKGFAVYQTMDFGMYTTKACAGIQSDDEALIAVTRQNGDVQAHNLTVGDYVLIRGSNTVPSIDGIHKVTRVDGTDNNKFFIDKYIEQEGNVGNIYPFRNVRFSSEQALLSALTEQINGVYKYNFSGVRQNNTRNFVYMYVDRISDAKPYPGMYKFNGNWSDANGHNGSLELVREAHNQCQNKDIENVKIYDGFTDSGIVNIETFDPVKGIVFGFVRDEIEFILNSDIASYNYNTLDGSIENYKTWGKDQLGQRWWDINTSVYFNYEQGSIDQIQQSWGKLFDGASIDIYEWTRSTVLPEQWENAVNKGITIDGNVASGEAYYTMLNGEKIYYWTEEEFYNTRTKNTEVYYYFWVKNKTSSYGQKNYNTNQLSVLLTNPSSYEIAWCAGAIDKNNDHFLLLNNISSYLTKNSVVQLNQIQYNNTIPLQEWTLLSENNPTCYIPEYLHIKIRDSLAGFNNFRKRYTYGFWTTNHVYTKDQVVVNNGAYYISLIDNNTNNQPSLDTTMTYWRRIYDFEIAQDTQQDDIDVWFGQEVPERQLHKFNRYGHLVRPRQSLYRDLREARHNFVDSVNKLLFDINIYDEIGDWESTFESTFIIGAVTYNTNRYWSWIDWHVKGFDTNTRADNYYSSKADMTSVSQQKENSYNLVRYNMGIDGINRPAMYFYKDGEYSLVWKAKSTIELSEEMWNESKFGNGFDTGGFDLKGFDDDSSFIISKLMDNLRNRVFKGRHFVKYNTLWFDLLKQAVLQNTTSDFAFKTTYVDLKVNHPLLTEQDRYLRFDMVLLKNSLIT